MARDEYKRQKNAKQHGGAIRHVVGLFASFLCGYLIASVFDMTSFTAWVNQQWANYQPANPTTAQAGAAATPAPAEQAENPKPKFEFYTLLSKDNASAATTVESSSSEQKTASATTEVSSTAALDPNSKPNPNLNPNSLAQPSVHIASETRVVAPSDALAEDATRTQAAPAQIAQIAEAGAVTQVSPKEPAKVVESRPLVQQASQPLSPKSNVSGKETYMLQVAAVARRQDADRLKASLTLKGYSVMIVSPTQANKSWYRVVIGPFHSRLEAEKAQLNVARTEHMQGMIRKIDV